MPNMEYASLLKKKMDLLLSYKAATERARNRLNETDSRAFSACMKERNRLIHEIVLTDRLLMPGGSEKKMTNAFEAGRNRTIQCLFKEMESLLSEIKKIEDDCIHSAVCYLRTLKEDLLAARRSRKGAKGYRPKIESNARFVDTRIT